MARYFAEYPGVTCFHELLRHLKSRRAFHKVMEADIFMGNADCGLPFTDFQQRWSEAPTVIIERPAAEVAGSLRRMGLEEADRVVETLQESLARVEGLRIPYSALDDRMEDIHIYLGIPYNQAIHQHYLAQHIADQKLNTSPEAFRVWTEDS